jgi:hypothetical protein
MPRGARCGAAPLERAAAGRFFQLIVIAAVFFGRAEREENFTVIVYFSSLGTRPRGR